MDKIIENLIGNYDEIEKECYLHSGELPVENSGIFKKSVYFKEYLDKQYISKLCTTEGNSKLDFCAAMDNFGKPIFMLFF